MKTKHYSPILIQTLTAKQKIKQVFLLRNFKLLVN